MGNRNEWLNDMVRDAPAHVSLSARLKSFISAIKRRILG